MEVRELICIGCPLGCALQVKTEAGEIWEITGNTCRRGEDYARKEVTNPTRIVTTTVRVNGAALPVVSVKTKEDIPKGKIYDCIKELNRIEVEAPVRVGDVVAKDIAGTGVDVVATKECL